MTQKELDLDVADRLESLASYLATGEAIAQDRMTVDEYLNLMRAIRYAVSTLRSTK